METTLIIVKPDAIARMAVGAITSRFEAKGLLLVGMKMTNLSDDVLRSHYSHLADEPFFPGITEFMQRTPVVLQAWRGVDAVRVARMLVGATNGRDADVGSIRGDWSMSIQANLVHASDSVESAGEELARFFDASEVHDYPHPLGPFINSSDEAG